MSRSLAEALSNLYPDSNSIRRILEEARIPIGHISLNDSAMNIWARAIERSRQNQQLWDLIEIPFREYSENVDLREAWEHEQRSRRMDLIESGEANTVQTLMLDLIWETRSEQKELRKEMSTMRHDTRERFNSMGLEMDLLKRLTSSQSTDIAALQDRPEVYGTRVVFAVAIIAGILGGIFAGWGRLLWDFLVGG